MHPRRPPRFVPGSAALVLGALACSGPERLTDPSAVLAVGISTQIVDATTGNEPHFYWLPPIAAASTYPGAFDNAVQPEIRLCRLTGTLCATAIATYTRSSSPAITVSTTSQSYSLDWSTKPASITNGDYRAEVWVAGRRMGLADARVVTSAKDLKTVPAGFVGVQSGKSLTFSFRLEAGIVGSITIAPQKPTIETGATKQLTATVLDVRGAAIAGAPVVWTSAAPAIATVSSTGLVTGVSENITIITATSGPVSAKDTVVIVRPKVDQIVVNPSGTSVEVGKKDTLWATTVDARGNILTDRPVTWTSSNTAVATVDQGTVTGVAPGSVDITATSEGVSGSVAVTVTPVIVPPPAPVARVEVAPQLISLTVGQTATFTATAYDAANSVITGRPATWLTGDTSVVAIAPNGVATATGPGFVYVMGTVDNRSDSAMVEVTGATVTCLRPWALPQLWFLSNPYGRAIRAHYGLPQQLSTVPPGTISGNYYPVALGGSGAGTYIDNIVACNAPPVTLGAANPLGFGNLVGPTLTALDSLFKLDQGATWDSTANGGLGAIVSSNAPPGAESARVVLVGLYDIRDHPPGTSFVHFRRTAYVFVETYSRDSYPDTNEVKGDIVFRFLRFGP